LRGKRKWGDIECLYKARHQLELMEAYSQTLGIDERGENERQSENDCKMKTLGVGHGAREKTSVGANKTKKERIVQREKF